MSAISGTAAFISRITNLRSVVRSVGNSTSLAPSVNRNLIPCARSYSVETASNVGIINDIMGTGDEVKQKKKTSKAMKAYLERAKQYDEFMKKEVTEYHIGKRHLANMMGMDPETFTQNDVNKSIRYLFPSGLFEPRARPIMEVPEKIFPPRKAAEFDESGRPHHTLFYTCKPYYHQTLHDIVAELHNLDALEDKEMKRGITPHPDSKINLLGSEWFTQAELEEYLLETIREEDYDKFLVAANRLADHPYAFKIKDFLLTLRKRKTLQADSLMIPQLRHTKDGRPFITVKDCKRKTARANVTVLGNGSGKITINGKDISYFGDIQSREQATVEFHLGKKMVVWR